jgi:DNA-binding NarL/FixJ family response regulator
VSPYRVLVADDHPPTRAGVRAAFDGTEFSVCAEEPDAAGAVEAALRTKPDICLLDIHMPGNGITAAYEISAALPDSAIVMLTVSTNDEDLFAALRAGAVGYLLKDTDPARLPHALQGVLDGEAALPRPLVARVLEEFRGREKRRRFRGRSLDLTTREWEVLELLREGSTTAEIAARLRISEVTVRTHVAAILRKLRVKNRRAALELLKEYDASSGGTLPALAE